MSNTMWFHHEDLDRFSIVKHQGCPGTDAFFDYDRTKWLNLIDGTIGFKNGNFNLIPCNEDYLAPYRYYTLTFNKGAANWLKFDTFTIYQVNVKGKSKQLLFVRNNENGHLDNVLYKRTLDDIRSRIIKNNRVFVVSNHAVDRAKLRLPEVSEYNTFQVISHLLSKVNREAKPAHIKKEYSTFSLLKYNFQHADYYMDHDRNVYVVHDHVLLTVHGNESERWKLN